MEENREIKSSRSTEGVGDVKKVKYLIFKLGEERYGIPLNSVKEVIAMVDITPIPHVPKFFKGILNLRGKIISVIDLRLKFSLSNAEVVPKKTSIIITDINGLSIATIVDDVEEVRGFEPSQIETALELQGNIGKEFVTGVAKTTDKSLILLLDILRILSGEEMNIVKEKMKKDAA